MVAARLVSLSLAESAAPPTAAAAAASAVAAAASAVAPTSAPDRLVSIGAGFKSRKELLQYVELKTRPDSCDDKRGATGTTINLVTNFFKMSQWVRLSEVIGGGEVWGSGPNSKLR